MLKILKRIRTNMEPHNTPEFNSLGKCICYQSSYFPNIAWNTNKETSDCIH